MVTLCIIIDKYFYRELAIGNLTIQPNIFYFAHSLTIGALMYALNIDHIWSDVQTYRTSLWDTFAANVIAVFHKLVNVLLHLVIINFHT